MVEQNLREIVDYALISYLTMAPLIGVGIYLTGNALDLIKGIKQNTLEKKASSN